MALFRRKQVPDFEIAPDEIFLDATNTPSFDTNRFEGRLEQPLSSAPFFAIAIGIGAIFLVLLGQALKLQIMQGSAYAAQSLGNSLSQSVLVANRGVITDRNGIELVTNIESDGVVKRSYPTPGFGALLGHVSYPKKDRSGHYYDTEITGLAGIEFSANALLAGTNGTLLVEQDALGKTRSSGVINPPKNGTDLMLTIDHRAQKAFFEAVSSLADQVPFLGGAGVLMEVDTGSVRALVSYPEYDPNVLSSGVPAETIAAYNKNKRKPYLDRAITGLYAPGSIVKPLEAAGALMDGIITPEVTVNSTGSISIPNPYDPAHPSIFKDWKALGVMNVRSAIAWSSDIYFYAVGGGYGGIKGLGIERLAYWYRVFGLEEATGIELPNESIGFVPTPLWKQKTYDEAWRIGDTYHTAIGQYAMQVTPIEMARAIAAIANGGKLVKPTLLATGVGQQIPLPLNPSVLQIVREGMRKGVTEGTSVGLSSLDSVVHIAGKTGTAQTGVHNEFHNSWAVGFFPYEHPKYVYVVVMEKGPANNSIGGVFVINEFLHKLYKAAPEYFE
jgi:penicillin-binding protein 2